MKLTWLLPSTATWLLGAAGLGIFFLGILVGLAFLFTPQEGGVTTAVAMVSLFASFPAAVAFVLAAIFEKKLLVRGAVLLGTSIFGAACGLATGIAMGADTDAGTGIFGAVCFFGLPVLGLAAAGIYYLVRGIPDARHRDVLDAISHNGEGRVPDAALAGALLRSGRFQGFYDPGTGLLCTARRLAEKKSALAGLAEARGSVTMAQAGAELGVSQDTLKAWIYELVGEGRFKGSVDWRTGTLFGSAPRTQGSSATCASCGGQLATAGRGILHCAHCDTDWFV